MQDSFRSFSARSQKLTPSQLLQSTGPAPFRYRDIIGILGRRAHIFIRVPAGAAIALMLYVGMAPQQYAATATVLMDLPNPEKAEAASLPSMPPRALDADVLIDSQIKLIRSPAILSDVVERVGLVNDSEFAAPPGLLDRFKKRLSLRASAADCNGANVTQSRALQRLQDRISVRRDEKTLLVNIEATSAQASKAAAIANAAARAYLNRSDLGKAHLVTAGTTPLEPQPPIGWPTVGIVLTAATLFGGILATFADRSDSRIKTLAQLNEISGLPTLAIIPQVGIRERARRARPSRDDLKQYDPDLKVLLPPALQPPLMRYAYDDPTSTFADGIRAIRLAVQRAHETAKSDVVMVTSASDSEGKSTISTNLARSFAMAGVHTVLVDCDLRNPEVTNSLCPRVERGLTDLTSENYTVEQCILDEEVSGLSILPAPPSRDFTRRTEFAFSPQFSDVLTQLRKRFDLIILDAPPLIPLTDSRALADHADNIIVTAAWNQTRQDVLAEGLLLLEPNLHRVVGCVLSRVDMHRIRYYDSFYGEAYREPYRPS